MIKYVIIIMVLFALGSCETNYGTINTVWRTGSLTGICTSIFKQIITIGIVWF